MATLALRGRAEEPLAIEFAGRTFLYRYGSGLKLAEHVAPGNEMERNPRKGPSLGKSGVELDHITNAWPNPILTSWTDMSGATASQPFDLDAMMATIYVTFAAPRRRQGPLNKAILGELRS